MSPTLPRGLRGDVLRAVAESGDTTLQGILEHMTPAAPALKGPIAGPVAYRNRRVARIVYAIAADFWRFRNASRVSNALSWLTRNGWIQPVGDLRLTPLCRRLLEERAESASPAAAVVGYQVARARYRGEHPQADQWPLDRVAEVVSHIAAGHATRADLAAAMGDSPKNPSGTTKRAIRHAVQLCLVELPQERRLTLRALDALGSDRARVPETVSGREPAVEAA